MADSENKPHLNLVIVGHIDAGKCLAYGTKIRMFDCSLKQVQDVEVGDLLMGDDSTSRKVLSTVQGEEEMFDVVPTKGQKYTVTGDHVLCLKASNCEMVWWDKNRNRYRVRWLERFAVKEKSFSVSAYQTKENAYQAAQEYLANDVPKIDGYVRYGDIVEIKARDFMKLPKRFQSLFKTYSASIDSDKFPTLSKHPKDGPVRGIKIVPAGVQEYYGFQLDGNHRFLLEDFTVTHNSTTTGHLLFKLGGIDKRQLEKLEQEAKTLGKDSFSFAFYTDTNKEERARGVTINCATKQFFTDNYHYTIIDAPGHRDFVKNMFTGASQADVAILMVPADKGGFEAAIAKGNHKRGEIEGQTRQHAHLCYILGIKQLIVGINKMDANSVNYSEERYNEIKTEVGNMLVKLGYKPRMNSIPFIPFSGWTGENLTERTDKMPWYKGFKVKVGNEMVEGYTLLDALNNAVRVPVRATDKPFRMPVSQLLKIKGVGDVVTGRVEQGVVKPGNEIRFLPSKITGKVFSLEMHHRSVPQAISGDNVGVNVKGLGKSKLRMDGEVMVIVNDPAAKSAGSTSEPMPTKSFVAKVFVQDHPGQLYSAKDGKGGYTPSILVRTARVPCKMVKINWKVGKSTGKVRCENPAYVEAHDQAEVVFEPQKPLYMETFKECPGLGSFAIMDSNTVIMLGMVVSVDSY